MQSKKDLEIKIETTQKQLDKAEREKQSWNNGKYKTSSSAAMSNLLVDSLKAELQKLSQELKNNKG